MSRTRQVPQRRAKPAGRSEEELALGTEVGVAMTWPGNLVGPGGVQSIMGFPRPALQGLRCSRASGVTWGCRHLTVTGSRCPPDKAAAYFDLGSGLRKVWLWRTDPGLRGQQQVPCALKPETRSVGKPASWAEEGVRGSKRTPVAGVGDLRAA